MDPTVRCPHCHGEVVKQGDRNHCPACNKTFCGKPTEIYTRCVGYYRPVSNFNKGKKQEFRDRLTFSRAVIDTGLGDPRRSLRPT